VGELVKLRQESGAGEPDLIEACRQGDRAALQQVFSAHAEYLERLLGRILGPSADIEDLLQSTFVAAIGAFPRFRGEAHVRTWLARIAIRIAQQRLHSAAHRRRAQLDDLDARADETGRADHIERDLDTRRQLDRLYVHLRAIGAKKQLAFVLHVFEGHPLEEVAALTGASLTATKSRVFWARRELLRCAARDPLLRGLLDERSR
jgi:RNA polymerase sigma-70 factor (ECF subfamily)